MTRKTTHFIRHYVEMVIAMLVGMAVLGGGGALVLAAVGADIGDVPELHLLGMAFTMTVPMVAWMRHRGHGWTPAWEMTGSMLAPTVAAIALLWLGAVEDTGTLMAIQHATMFPAMLLVMLLRLDEYTSHP
jgi:hypothetical protein